MPVSVKWLQVLFWISHSISLIQPTIHEPKVQILSSFTHRHVFPYLYDFSFSSVELKIIVLFLIFHKMEANSNQNYLVTKIFQNISFCVPQKKVSDSVWFAFTLNDLKYFWVVLGL